VGRAVFGAALALIQTTFVVVVVVGLVACPGPALPGGLAAIFRKGVRLIQNTIVIIVLIGLVAYPVPVRVGVLGGIFRKGVRLIQGAVVVVILIGMVKDSIPIGIPLAFGTSIFINCFPYWGIGTLIQGIFHTITIQILIFIQNRDFEGLLIIIGPVIYMDMDGIGKL